MWPGVNCVFCLPKRLMKQLFLLLTFLNLLSACKQPDAIPESRHSYLVKHSWDYTSMSVNGSPQTLSPCLVDDIWTFGSTGSVLLNFGDLRCSFSQPQNVSGTFSLSPDQNTLYITHSGSTFTYSVNNIDEYTLDVSEAIGLDTTRYILNAR